MTLVVAHRTEDSIIFVADTKLTYRARTSNPLLEGVVKIVFLNNFCAIGFSGDLDDAERVLNELSSNSDNSQVLKVLQNGTKKGTVSFLVGLSGAELKLYKIDSGQIFDIRTAWIGDYQGFSEYQRYFHDPNLRVNTPNYLAQESGVTMNIIELPGSCSPDTQDIYSRMFRAMDSLIDSQEIDSIGGVVVSAFSERGVFKFPSYCGVSRRPLDLTELEATGGTVPFGDTAMGSFIIVAGGVGQDAFAFHLLHGALGVTFDRTCSSLLLTPQLYSQTDEIDFFDFLEAKYGSITLISVGSTDVQFFAKADWCYKNGDYSTAARLFTRGIRKTSVRWTGGEPNPDYCYGSLSECLSDQNQEIKVPVADVQILSTVLQMRGTCRVMQMLPSLALIDYEESVTLNSENWAAYYGMSQAYWMLGNPERAIESALRSHDLHPSDDIRNTYIQLLVALGRGSEAVRRFGSL